MQKEKFRKIIFLIVISFFSIILTAFIFRNQIFQFYLNRNIEKINRAYRISLVVGHARIQGISSISLSGLTVRPEHSDTLIWINTVSATFNPFRLLLKQIVLKDLMMKNVRLTFVKKGGKSNFKFLFEGGEKRAEFDREIGLNYARQISRLSGIIFSLFPRSMVVEDLNLTVNSDGHLIRVASSKVTIQDNAFYSLFRISEDDATSGWLVRGKLFPSDHTAGLIICPGDEQKMTLPFMKYRWGATVRFDTISFNLSEKEEGETTGIKGIASIRGLCIDHPRIASVPVIFDRLAIDYLVRIHPDFLEIDSATRVTFNNLDFHPWATYRTIPSKQVKLSIHKPAFPAQDLFSSLPDGLFSVVSGIRARGSLSWFLDFSLDLNLPDSLFFETGLQKQNFSVLSYGSTDLQKINTAFTYTAYEKGQPVKSFIVGPENPDFRPLDKISPYLRMAVLGSEDAGFFQHRGFLPEAFRESFISNIKERRFVRGGSTISMQLVKNVFLNRNKTIARKLEEALIVWLIENQQLCSKERMFEVYLNIIEWGPGIYGASEASRFYFNKDASKLTLAESVFLASVIPRPKWFRYSFEKDGTLRQSTVDFLNLLSGKLVRKGEISQQEFEKFIPEVGLKGRAKMMLQKIDSVPSDTLEYDDETL